MERDPAKIVNGDLCEEAAVFWHYGIDNTDTADIFVSMKTLTKRELVRKPSIVSSLKPGESVAIKDGGSELIVTRKARKKMSAEEFEAKLQEIFKGDPEMDCQAILHDLRE